MNIFAIGIATDFYDEYRHSKRVLKLCRDQSGELAWELREVPIDNHNIHLAFEFKYSDCYKGWTAHDTYAWYYPFKESHLQCK